MIKERVAVNESAAQKIPIFSHRDSLAVEEFKNFSIELLTRIGD